MYTDIKMFYLNC